MTTQSTMPTPEQLDTTFLPGLAAQVVAVSVEDEAVLYHPDLRTLHLLDPIATVVADRYDGRSSVAEIADDLATAFSAPVDVVTADVLRMTRDLAEVGLLGGVVLPEGGEDGASEPQRLEEALVDGCQ